MVEGTAELTRADQGWTDGREAGLVVKPGLAWHEWANERATKRTTKWRPSVGPALPGSQQAATK